MADFRVIEPGYRDTSSIIEPGESHAGIPSILLGWRTIQGIETVNMIRKGQVSG